MKVALYRKNKRFHFEASGSSSVLVSIDANAAAGGNDLGARPMELILMALGGCSAIDVISMLKKQRLELDDLQIQVEGERAEGAIPAVFTKIHITYEASGAVKREKIEQAIALSIDKYCSVTAMLKNAVEISWSLKMISTI